MFFWCLMVYKCKFECFGCTDDEFGLNLQALMVYILTLYPSHTKRRPYFNHGDLQKFGKIIEGSFW